MSSSLAPAARARAVAAPADVHVLTARAAGLVYVADQSAGITRRRRGKSFEYHTLSGARVRSPATLARIRALAIPPAWTQVWICADARGHIQATGRDARGRKQYRYHAAFSAERGRHKYERMFELSRALPKIRAACDADMRKPGLPREKVLAAIVRLREHTLIRHPALLSAYERGSVMPRIAAVASQPSARRDALERAVIAYLRRCARLGQDAERGAVTSA